MEHAEIVIVGAGQAGLAAAHAALATGIQPLVLEASDEPAGSWPRYYDSLTLFSPARYSELPDRKFPGDPDRYPTRDELADYLRAYAADLGADIRCGQRVTATTVLPGGGFELQTAAGLRITAERLVGASGGFGAPVRPDVPGLAGFSGTVLHTADYRRPQPFAGQRVVVVGGGNSAMQIAAELADVAHVTMATRRPLRFRAQVRLGRDVHWWLAVTGLDTGTLGRRLMGGADRHRRRRPLPQGGRRRQA